MKEPTFVHTSDLGRRAAGDYHKARCLLKIEEEGILIWRYDIFQRPGFPLKVSGCNDTCGENSPLEADPWKKLRDRIAALEQELESDREIGEAEEGLEEEGDSQEEFCFDS